MQADDGPLPSFEGRLPSTFCLCTSALWILVPVGIIENIIFMAKTTISQISVTSDN